jgi:hypothetical protein
LAQGQGQVLDGDLLAAVPLAFNPLLVVRECGGKQLHHLGDEPVCRKHRLLRVIDESLPDLLPPGAEAFCLLGPEERGSIGLRRGRVVFAPATASGSPPAIAAKSMDGDGDAGRRSSRRRGLGSRGRTRSERRTPAASGKQRPSNGTAQALMPGCPRPAPAVTAHGNPPEGLGSCPSQA